MSGLAPVLAHRLSTNVYTRSVCSCRVPTSGSVHHRLRTGIISRSCNARRLPAYYQTMSAYGLCAVSAQSLCAHEDFTPANILNWNTHHQCCYQLSERCAKCRSHSPDRLYQHLRAGLSPSSCRTSRQEYITRFAL